MRINHNLMAMNTHRQLGLGNAAASKSMEKLSSGTRINRAGDDAAGLAISEKMRGQIRGLNQASRNAQDGISLIQTAEGALQETHAILQRMRELSVQAANDTNVSVDRDAIKDELTALKTEITRIGTSTEFNKQKLLDGTLGSSTTLHASLTVANGINAVSTNGTAAGTYTITAATAGGRLSLTITKGGVSESIASIAAPGAGTSSKVTFASFGISLEVNSAFTAAVQGNLDTKTIAIAASGVDLQIGANNSTEQKLTVNINNMKSSALGVGGSATYATLSVDGVDAKVANATDARQVVDVLEKAITQVSTQRSKLGAYQNRLEHTIKNLDTSSENLQASESRVRDVDMAKEMMEFSKNNILQQAAQAMLAQANQAPQGVLQLLR